MSDNNKMKTALEILKQETAGIFRLGTYDPTIADDSLTMEAVLKAMELYAQECRASDKARIKFLEGHSERMFKQAEELQDQDKTIEELRNRLEVKTDELADLKDLHRKDKEHIEALEAKIQVLENGGNNAPCALHDKRVEELENQLLQLRDVISHQKIKLLERRSAKAELLEKYSEWLHKVNYIDTDFYTEKPTAIDEFMRLTEIDQLNK